MSTIDDLLNRFAVIDLAGIDKVKLLNRIDTKFLFAAENLPEVLERMLDQYILLQIEGVSLCRYETIYYDTPDLAMYVKHHNGKLNRFKVRARKYLESNISFFEVKFKNNRGRTVKTRVPVQDINGEMDENSIALLSQITPFTAKELLPALQVNYSRMTFINTGLTERVTIDVDLEYSHHEKGKSYPRLVIAELKQSRSKHSSFRSIMNEGHFDETSISKYCLGILSLNDHVKSNNFKPKLLLINKIDHDVN